MIKNCWFLDFVDVFSQESDCWFINLFTWLNFKLKLNLKKLTFRKVAQVAFKRELHNLKKKLIKVDFRFDSFATSPHKITRFTKLNFWIVFHQIFCLTNFWIKFQNEFQVKKIFQKQEITKFDWKKRMKKCRSEYWLNTHERAKPCRLFAVFRQYERGNRGLDLVYVERTLKHWNKWIHIIYTYI